MELLRWWKYSRMKSNFFTPSLLLHKRSECLPRVKAICFIFDGVIIAHCNEAEWNRFQSEHTNEAILDRVVKVDVPYCLELDQEVKIYEKMINQSDFNSHIAPHTLRVVAMFSIMSRLKNSQKCDLLTKMKIYNGEDVIEKGRVKRIDIKDLREESRYEGCREYLLDS